MNKKEILKRKERKICDYLLKKEKIQKIYVQNRNAWLKSFNQTKDFTEALRKTNKDPYRWNTREVIVSTIWFLSDMVDEFTDEVEKLNDKTPEDKKIYKDLSKLPIEELVNPKQKALFIIIGHIYENRVNILK